MGNISGEIEGHIEKMASLNYIVPKVIQIANDNNSSARDIIKVIQMDPVLTGKALKLVNSAFFGLSNEIANLSRAVVLLGMSTIRNLALSCSVMSSFKFNDKICKLTSEDFWKYSMGVSAMCQLIARFRKETKKDIDEYFLAGMLHNIGKALLVQCYPEEYNTAIEIAENEGIPIGEAEEETFGVSHQVVGERLAQKWKLPEIVIDSMLHYTDPTESQEKHTLVISISSFLLKQSHIGFSGDYFEHKISDELWNKAKISYPAAFNLVQTELPSRMEEAQKFIKGN
jgi:HD-like signal output (HDOD) protein